MRHLLPQQGQLLGVRGADYRSHHSVPAIASRFLGEPFDIGGDVLVDRSPVGDQILNHLTPRIGSFHEHEHARCPRDGDIDKGLQAIAAQVRAHGKSVGSPSRSALAAEESLGVGHGRRSNVVSLAVHDDQESLRAGIGDRFHQDRHSRRPQFLKESGLGLHRRYERGHDIDHASAKGAVRGRAGLDGQVSAGTQARGKRVHTRIEPYQHRVAAATDRFIEAIWKTEHDGVLCGAGVPPAFLIRNRMQPGRPHHKPVFYPARCLFS